MHRPRRIRLRPRDARQSRERGSTRCQMQKTSTRTFHGASSRKSQEHRKLMAESAKLWSCPAARLSAYINHATRQKAVRPGSPLPMQVTARGHGGVAALGNGWRVAEPLRYLLTDPREPGILRRASPGFKGKRLSRDDLESLTWISREEGSATRVVAENALAELGIVPKRR